MWISRREISRLAKHLNLTLARTIEQYCRKIGQRFSLKEHRSSAGQYDCVFLKEEGAEARQAGGGGVVHRRRICTIYPVRPLQCRTWPFWSGNLSSEENWKDASRGCPGMGVGAARGFSEIEAIRTARDWDRDGSLLHSRANA
ncbi:MAG: YkgJ family cysteine cluster protein [Tepidisphaeraceae bacterium]